MPKLRHQLKETPEEAAEREWRRKRRKERKERHKPRRKADPSTSSTASKPKDDRHSASAPTCDSDEGWDAPSGSKKADLDSIRAEMEQARYYDQLQNAMDEDQRLDSIEAQFNSYIPPRWRNDHDTQFSVRAEEMNDEEYAEWMREGMWRRTHKAEMEERDRLEREKEERKAKVKLQRQETKRLEREAQLEKARKQADRERRAIKQAWTAYTTRWETLLEPSFSAVLTFETIPWPVQLPPEDPTMLTREAISTFLFSENHPDRKKSRRHRLREALRLYHPDRFMGKWMTLAQDSERQKIENGIGRVVRAMNFLMEEDAKDT